MKFSNLLIQWYLQNKRDLPWRNTTNPYLFGYQKSCTTNKSSARNALFFIFTSAFYCLAKKPMKNRFKLCGLEVIIQEHRVILHKAQYQFELLV
jgi:hypothetical protein